MREMTQRRHAEDCRHPDHGAPAEMGSVPYGKYGFAPPIS
jgi:hypothetical protein